MNWYKFSKKIDYVNTYADGLGYSTVIFYLDGQDYSFRIPTESALAIDSLAKTPVKKNNPYPDKFKWNAFNKAKNIRRLMDFNNDQDGVHDRNRESMQEYLETLQNQLAELRSQVVNNDSLTDADYEQMRLEEEILIKNIEPLVNSLSKNK